jgi:hypothetical protein
MAISAPAAGDSRAAIVGNADYGAPVARRRQSKGVLIELFFLYLDTYDPGRLKRCSNPVEKHHANAKN